MHVQQQNADKSWLLQPDWPTATWVCRGPRWLEADVDMDSSGVANHVVALVKGVTTSQTIDMAVVLQVCFFTPPL